MVASFQKSHQSGTDRRHATTEYQGGFRMFQSSDFFAQTFLVGRVEIAGIAFDVHILERIGSTHIQGGYRSLELFVLYFADVGADGVETFFVWIHECDFFARRKVTKYHPKTG